MRGRLKDLLVQLNGKQRLVLELDEDFRWGWDKFHEEDVEITIKKFRAKRSLDANAYAWVLIDQIAAELGVTKETVYRNAIRNIGGVSETVCVRNSAVEKLTEGWSKNGLGWQVETMPSKLPGCSNVILYYGSSTYDSKQMSALIDTLVDDCHELGLETRTPEEIESLIKEYVR